MVIEQLLFYDMGFLAIGALTSRGRYGYISRAPASDDGFFCAYS